MVLVYHNHQNQSIPPQSFPGASLVSFGEEKYSTIEDIRNQILGQNIDIGFLFLRYKVL